MLVRALLVALSLPLCWPAIAATPDEVLEWSKAGIPDAEVIARIRKSPAASVSTDELLRLRAAGVSDEVLRALVGSADATETRKAETPPEVRTRVIRTVDDIIAAHADGVPDADIEAVVRGLDLRIRRPDRERMLLAGVPKTVITAASLRPRMAGPVAKEDEFGDSGTTTIELAGGFGSTSVGEFSVSSGRMTVGAHRLLGSVVTVGSELDVTFGTGGVGRALWFGALGFEVPSKVVLARAIGRFGFGSDGVAYGVQVAILGRSGRLLAGVSFNATWTGDPIATILGLDLRIGTWF